MNKQLNFNNQKHNLTDDDISQILTIITYRCRVKTTNRILSIIKYSPSLIPSYGVFNRLIKEDNLWQYVAGQSYTDEIRTLRECILKG